MSLTKKEMKTKSVGQCLQHIYNNDVNEQAIKDMSKEKLENFILEVFNKGILTNYIGL